MCSIYSPCFWLVSCHLPHSPNALSLFNHCQLLGLWLVFLVKFRGNRTGQTKCWGFILCQWAQEDEGKLKTSSDSWTQEALWWKGGAPSVVQWHLLFKSTPAAAKCNTTPPPSQCASGDLLRLTGKFGVRRKLCNLYCLFSAPASSLTRPNGSNLYMCANSCAI